MPTYDYQCPRGHRFEVFQKMSDDPGAKCPECGAAAERKISGGAGFLFKGDGFYITESRSEEYKKKASAEGGSTAATEGGSAAATPAKSDGASGKGDAAKSDGGSSGGSGGSSASTEA
jgi:putative FmdB family regulatory protein